MLPAGAEDFISQIPMLCTRQALRSPYITRFCTRMVAASSVGQLPKRKMVKIGTHSGSFHCDEALGCFLLRQTDTYRDAEIIRSRDEEVLQDLDIIIDVGGKYDPGAWRASFAFPLVQPSPEAGRCPVWSSNPRQRSLRAHTEARRFDHHQRGFAEVFGHGTSCRLSQLLILQAGHP